jgi:type II secretory pathway component PulF
MLLSIAADERAALQFDDLASALDAGLPLPALGGDPALGDRVLHQILRARGVKLRANEDLVLEAAWRAGRAGIGLRNRAEQRRQRAAAARLAWQGLRYPVFLLVFLCFASLFVGLMLRSFYLPMLMLGVVATIVALGWFVRRGVQRGSERWLALPWLGRLLQDLGELPYLETLHAMYGAGVPLVQAHHTAVAAIGVRGVRDRLAIADRILTEGRPLAEALHGALALHTETRTLLATGEKTGQLEESLQKALVRRREVVGRNLGDLARWAGIAAYAIAVACALSYIGWIYATTLGRAFGAR